MKRLIKIGISILVVLILIIAGTLPVYAMTDPDNIFFGTAGNGLPVIAAFTNVSATGDMLFVAESYIDYASTPTTDASSAFLFEILSPDGSTVILSTPVWAYEDVPVSIYLTAAQVTSLGLTSGTSYQYRLTGNPLLFPTMDGSNTVTTSLSSKNWFNQSLNSGGTLSPLRGFSISMMQDIQTHDAVTTYLTLISGVKYITDVGSDIMLGGVVGLDVWCSQLFQFSVQNIVPTTPSSAGAYANTLNPAGQLGAETSLGLKEFGIFLGLGSNGVMAGGIVYLLLTLGAIVYMATRIQSPLVLPIGAIGMITIGAFLGFIPLALLFMVMAFIIILTAIYFFTRGFWT
jgi:hypothetical protein